VTWPDPLKISNLFRSWSPDVVCRRSWFLWRRRAQLFVLDELGDHRGFYTGAGRRSQCNRPRQGRQVVRDLKAVALLADLNTGSILFDVGQSISLPYLRARGRQEKIDSI
jgi:hypothetical protein